MTIARDARTGALLGQLVVTPGNVHLGRIVPSHNSPTVRLLTRDGRYVTVPAHSVRLEEIR